MAINFLNITRLMTDNDLHQIPIFSALSNDTRRAIAARIFRRSIPTNQSLVIEGVPAESCYFIQSGIFRVLRMSPDGKAQVLARLSQGAPVNVISLLMTNHLNRATVEALTPASVFVMQAGDFDYLLANYPEFAAMLLRIFADRIAQMTDLAAGLSLYSVRARLARFLIELADKPQTAGGWTQDEIAAQIGTVRDMVGRILREFEAIGLIRRDHHQIDLLDRDGLFAEAEIDQGNP